MSELVQLQLGKVFTDFRERVERLRDSILKGAQPIIRREWPISLRTGSTRWFRTGATLQSAVDSFGQTGDVKWYRFGPTTFYAPFGEYGTGQLGAATGRPAPAGWRYGAKRGMRARRFTRHTLAIAKPKIELSAIRKVRRFAANLTVD